MFGSSSDNDAKRARRDEAERQARIKQGSSVLRSRFQNAFNDKYYSDLLTNFQNAYLPEVKTQYEDAYNNMQAALMRSGLEDSSEFVRRDKLATKAKSDADAEVLSRGLQAQQQRQQDVAYAENTVLNQLVNTADASSAYAQAAAQIKNNRTPYVTPMLGQVFTDLGAGLATQADLERNNQAKYNVFGRSGWWSNPSRYTSNVRSG